MTMRPLKAIASPQSPIPARGRRLLQLRAARQERMDDLMARKNNGSLTGGEKDELRELVREAEALALTNARTLTAHDKRRRDH